MFDQFVNGSSARTRRPVAVALSFTGQTVLLALTILFPLLRTEALVPGRLACVVRMPQPRGEPKPSVQKESVARVSGKTGPRVFAESVLRQPAHVPNVILIGNDAPSADLSAPAGSPYGVPDGIIGAMATDVIPEPRVAPPQPIPLAPAGRIRLRVGGKVQAAKLLRPVTPVYPPLARQARISGIVRLEAVISRNGMIESLQVVSGHPLLVQAALDAVRQWVYRPTLLNGDPVEVVTQIEVNFKLGE